MSESDLLQIAKHIGRPLETACKLIENIFDPPTKNLGELLGDQVSYWRWANRLRIADKASQKLEAKGISPRALPMDFSIPFLRESGDAADEALQDSWAELLASAIADDSFANIAFVDTLHSMSPADVKFLDALLRTQQLEPWDHIAVVADGMGLTAEQVRMSFYNLERLGFFTPTGRHLKGFAIAFLKACSSNRGLVDAYRKKQKTLHPLAVMD